MVDLRLAHARLSSLSHGTVSLTNVIQPGMMMAMSGHAEIDRVSGGMVLGGLSAALRPSRLQKDLTIWLMADDEVLDHLEGSVMSPGIYSLLKSRWVFEGPCPARVHH